MTEKKRWPLGCLKNSHVNVYLYDFEWECNWYWGGGYIGNKNFHTHFDSAFLKPLSPQGHPLNHNKAYFTNPLLPPPPHYIKEEVKILSNNSSIWEDLDFFLDNAQYDSQQWWRIKDLFKQFYTLRDAAEVFQYGGHCRSSGLRSEELNLDMAASINKHIETIIIPEIRKALAND